MVKRRSDKCPETSRTPRGDVPDARGGGISSSIPVTERARLEYEYANARWTNGSDQRRSGLAFFTAVQGTILTIVGERITNLDASSRALVAFGLVVTLIAWNHERRIGAHMEGYLKRAMEIEEANDMYLLRRGRAAAAQRRTLSNRTMFAVHFLLIGVGWLATLAYDLLK